jgi:hypothetical protein
MQDIRLQRPSNAVCARMYLVRRPGSQQVDQLQVGTGHRGRR